MSGQLDDVMNTPPRISITPFEKKKFLIYGPAGVGKSTFFSKFKNHLFLNTDPGLEFLKVRSKSIESWKQFQKIVEELTVSSKEPAYKNLIVVLDLIDGLYTLCRKSVLTKYGLAHESDTPYGKTFDIVKTEFQSTISKLAANYGIGFISHSKETELKSRITTISKIHPTISGGAAKFIEGICDFIGYCETSTTKEEKQLGSRYITFTPNENLTAKDRAGLFPEKMPLDFDTVYNTYNKGFQAQYVQGKSVKTEIKKTGLRKVILKKK